MLGKWHWEWEAQPPEEQTKWRLWIAESWNRERKQAEKAAEKIKSKSKGAAKMTGRRGGE